MKKKRFLPVVLLLVVCVLIISMVRGCRSKQAGNGPLNQEILPQAVMKVEKGIFKGRSRPVGIYH